MVSENYELKASLYVGLVHYSKEVFYSGYSLGISKDELAKIITLVVDFEVQAWNRDNPVYGAIEFALCIAIIFKMNLE